MALGYELTVTDSKGTEIKLTSMDEQHGGREDIICASYKSNTLNDDSIARSNDVRAEIKIIGRITAENKDTTCELANWSKEKDSSLIYRKVKLTTYPSPSNPTLLRNYELENMFVLDYTESFDMPTENMPENVKSNISSENDNGLFELYLVQKNGAYSQYIESK